MALSRDSYRGGDWRDVAAALAAFQSINRCKIELRATAADHRGTADVALTLVATALEPVDGVVWSLASVSATCAALNLRTLEDAVLNLLYGLDGKLADGEFKKILGV